MNIYSELRSLVEVRGTASKEMLAVGATGTSANRREYMRNLMGELRDRPKKKKK